MAEKLYDPRLLFSGKRRRAWLRGAIVDDWMTGRIPEDSVNSLLDKTNESGVQRHLRDFVWGGIAVHYPGIVTLIAAYAYGAHIQSPEWVLGATIYHISPIKIGPGNGVRLAGLAYRAVEDRLFIKPKPPVLSVPKELLNLGVSLVSVIGNVSVPARMYKECPEVADYLLHRPTNRDYKIPAVNKFVSSAERFTQKIYHKLTESKAGF